MKLNTMIWITLCGILYNNGLLCCDLKASSDSSESKLESTAAHLKKMRTWIEKLTEVAIKESDSSDQRSRIIAIKNNLHAILEVVEKDQSDSASGARMKPEKVYSKKSKSGKRK